jgi:hypothetical protein
MALFTDTAVITLDDLASFENTIGQVASAHGINVDTKIALATSDIAAQLKLWLLDQRPVEPLWFNVFLTRNLLDLSTVVVTPTLYRWLCTSSLAKVFAEAYNAQLNTRFQAKMTEYQQETSNSAELVLRAGLGMVFKPLTKPPMPLLSVQTGNLPAQSIYFQTTWVDSAGNEGAPSEENGFILGSGSGVTVAIVPNPASVPAAAAGWNVYAGNSADGLMRQNVVPIATGAVWQMPDSGITFGPAPGTGQQPDYWVPLSRRMLRG